MQIIETIKNLISPKWTLVYAPEKSMSRATHQAYSVDNPHTAEKLFNKGVHVGFVTSVHNREGKIRAFRFDRIVSLARD